LPHAFALELPHTSCWPVRLGLLVKVALFVDAWFRGVSPNWHCTLDTAFAYTLRIWAWSEKGKIRKVATALASGGGRAGMSNRRFT
jgi:hypothetical protein